MPAKFTVSVRPCDYPTDPSPAQSRIHEILPRLRGSTLLSAVVASVTM